MCGCCCAHHCYHPPRYSIGRVMVDLFLIIMTGGLWFIWVILRYLRSNTRY